MAGDGRMTCGSRIVHDATCKVTRLDDGRIVGTAGNATLHATFTAWLIAADGTAFSHPYGDEVEFDAIVLHPNGAIEGHDHTGLATPLMAPAAIGSGCEFAQAAMTMGADPRRAVEVAMRHDIFTGGTITVLSID